MPTAGPTTPWCSLKKKSYSAGKKNTSRTKKKSVMAGKTSPIEPPRARELGGDCQPHGYKAHGSGPWAQRMTAWRRFLRPGRARCSTWNWVPARNKTSFSSGYTEYGEMARAVGTTEESESKKGMPQHISRFPRNNLQWKKIVRGEPQKGRSNHRQPPPQKNVPNQLLSRRGALAACFY